MKNKFIVIITFVLLLLGGIFTVSFKTFDNKDSEKVQLDEVKLKDLENSKSNNTFAIMTEDTKDSGNYSEFSQSGNSWPDNTYYFNSYKSGCVDNNGEKVTDASLSFNDQTKKASVSTTKTVYCYLYFSQEAGRPDVTEFYVGTSHGSEYTNQTNQNVHIGWNDGDVTDYCLTTTNSPDECEWISVSNSLRTATHETVTNVQLLKGDRKYDYDAYLKDKSGNISKLDNESQDEITLDTQAPELGDIRKGSVTETSITVSVTAEDPAGIDTQGSGFKETTYKIRKKRETSNYIGTATENGGSGTTSHTFNSGLEAGTEYTVEVTAVDNVGNTSALKTLDITTAKKSTASDTLTTSPGSYLKQSNKGDLKWRYVGNQSESGSIKNYVCFGASSCTGETDNHLYRIIGITEQGNLKIQKNSSITTSQWHTSYQSDIKWPNSTMYTSTLTNTFYGSTTYVTESMKSKIDTTHKWNTGDVNGTSASQIGTGDTVYNLEQGTKTHTGAVGLAYLSDYYFAYNEQGTQNCYSSSPYCKSWMVPSNYTTLWSSQSYEWTMTRYGHDGSDYGAWYVYCSGVVNWDYLAYACAVRPVFYLKSDVTITGGNGTSSSPYIIN